jgi:hypothetical protein
VAVKLERQVMQVVQLHLQQQQQQQQQQSKAAAV